MNQLIKTSHNESGDIIVSGRELHEFLEVRTRYDIWFNRMKEYGFVENIDFIEVVQKRTTSHGRIHDMIDHHIKLDMAKEISMLQRTDKGKQARQYFIRVEKLWNSPEMIVQRALQIQQAKIKQLEGQIKRDEPYTNFGKVVSCSDASINVGAFAKLMYDKHGIKLGRNKMFEWLREKGFLIKSGRERNNPKQEYIEKGWFETTVTLISRSSGDIESLTTMITGKGQVKLAQLLIEEFKTHSSRGELVES